MGEKVYKPIVKDGNHLLRSKDNPDRVRGLTRDENNQNPDIIEWEEYDVDDDYIGLPDSYDINEYRMMENFVYSLPKGKNQTILYNAIQGRGAFRRFKDKLYEIGMANDWYKYRDQQYKEIALEWCEENNIEVIE